MVSTTARREAVEWLRETRNTSLRRACRVVGLSTATWRYRPRLNEANAQLVEQLPTPAAAGSRFGYRRLHVLIARAGTPVNHKRLYRMYRAAGLQVRRRRRKRLTRGERVRLPAPTRRGERWSMGFTLDTLADGRAFRTLNMVADFTRQCVAIEGDRSLPGLRVSRARSPADRDRPAGDDRGRQRAGVCGAHARRVGLSHRRYAPLHSAGQADRERVRRELQREI